ncbi:MAG: hypothetical protein COT74_02270, partial [Bdellovibrionales bacterium CG10_big_fil_rev_8_21_14_0_10_45_34]
KSLNPQTPPCVFESKLTTFLNLKIRGTSTIYVFSGKRRNLIKILYFDRSGFCLWQKRLERAKFVWPKKDPSEVIHISTEQLQWLLTGYDIWKMRAHAELKFEKVC